MIDGHGDDIYKYGKLRCDFSSNISFLTDTLPLYKHLASRMHLINHYPEPSASSLETLMAKKLNISPDEVMATSGATDAIYLVAQTLRNERSFSVSKPTFSEYADACRIFGYEESPHDGAIRWLCNPNNPTGEVHGLENVRMLSSRHNWLVIDQSYEDYTQEPLLSPQSAIALQNTIVIHSMTKRFAIPGLRLGFIVAPSPVIARLRANARPWAVNALAIEAGCWLLEHITPSFSEEMSQLLHQTQLLRNQLCQINGLHVYPTKTNFMLCSLKYASAAALKEYLVTEHGFLIRDASNFERLSAHHFRIATQQPEYNQELAEAIKTFVYMKK